MHIVKTYKKEFKTFDCEQTGLFVIDTMYEMAFKRSIYQVFKDRTYADAINKLYALQYKKYTHFNYINAISKHYTIGCIYFLPVGDISATYHFK